MTRDEMTIKKFEAALAEKPEASPVELLTAVLAQTKSAPAGGSGATAQRIIDHLLATPGGGTFKEVAEAVGCSVGRVYEVARAEGSPLAVAKGEGKAAARVYHPQAEAPAKPAAKRSRAKASA